MTTISLRTLLREPLKVKRMTRTGRSVKVTDNGQPLWLIQPVVTEKDTERHRREIEELLDEVMQRPPSKVSLSKIVLDSRIIPSDGRDGRRAFPAKHCRALAGPRDHQGG